MQQSIIRRVAFDIGSLTTKMIVADVDVNTNSIIKIITKETRKTEYKHDLEEQGHTNYLSQSMIEKGIKALKELKAECALLHPQPQEYAAVATAALRTAKNSALLIEQADKELNIPITIISQEKEAHLGFYGALIHTGYNKKKSIVWDLGGGSMQITTENLNGKLFFYGADMGLTHFTHEVITDIQKKAHAESPNPLSPTEAAAAIAYATKLAKKVPTTIATKCADQSTEVIGIGAIYYATHANKNVLTIFTQNDLLQLLAHKLNKTDQMLAPETHPAIPVSVSATSLTFIIGFMKQLNIDKMTIVEVNINDGLLIDSTYYHPQ